MRTSRKRVRSPTTVRQCTLIIKNVKWIPLTNAQLDLSLSLSMGQCFNWAPLNVAKEEKDHEESRVWVGTMGDFAVALRQVDHVTEFAQLKPSDNAAVEQDRIRGELEDYFQLSEDIPELYARWVAACPRMREIAHALPGVRVVRQDPW